MNEVKAPQHFKTRRSHLPETGASSIHNFNTSIMTSKAPASVSSFRFFFATPGTSDLTRLLIESHPSMTKSRPFGFKEPSILLTKVLLGINLIWTWSFVGRYWPMTSMAAARCYIDSNRRAPGVERQPAPTGCVRVVLVPRARLCRLAWGSFIQRRGQRRQSAPVLFFSVGPSTTYS